MGETAALAIAGLIALCFWLVLRRRRGRAPASGGAGPPAAVLAGETAVLGRELSLAAEHVQSIRLLLEISRSHQQPIPGAALRNLELVSKHLLDIRRRVDPEAEDLNAPVRLPSAQAPPHPRPLSFGCRVSPSDRSTPSG